MEELMSAYGGRLLIAILGVGIGFLCLIGVLWMLRGRRGPSPFIRGGRNRQPRLQVLDAAAVDARRRLVLVRRDDIEHLIMIGGPSDLVIESGIQASGAMAQEQAAETPARTRPSTPPEIPVTPDRTQPAEPRRDVPKRQLAVSAAPSPAEPTRRLPPTGNEIPYAANAPAPIAAPVATPAATAPPVAIPVLGAAVATAPTARVEPGLGRGEPILENAADILDAARNRVLQGPAEPIRSAQNSAPPPQQAASPALGSDFERILEQEMASNLAAREASQEPSLLPPDADAPRPAANKQEPSLQDEMARIFGEMSAGRDR